MMNNILAWQGLRTGPGILILRSTGEVEYLNSRAHAFIRQLHASPDLGVCEHLPPVVMRVAESIQTLAMSDRAKAWERLEISTVAGAQDSVLIRGFGLPSGEEKEPIRVLLLLETRIRHARFDHRSQRIYRVSTGAIRQGSGS